MKIEFVLLAILVLSVRPQVLGIDLGTQFWKAALISPGKSFVIVENTRSERKTPQAISFIDGVRLFEDEALYKKVRFPLNTFTDLNTLMTLLDDPTLEVAFPQTYTLRDGNLYFTVDQQEISLEQIMGMILRNIKILASKQAGTQIKDCAISIPANWGLGARLAVVNAANIAGLSVLSIINSNTAAALNYAMTRSDQQPLYVMIVNTGSHYLEMSVVKFFGVTDNKTNKTIQGVEVLSHSASTDVNGYLMDEAIANILAEKFKTKHKLDLKSNKRAWDTLVAKSSDAKEILSANKDTNVYIQSIMEGIDLQIHITRKQLENAGPFDKLVPALDMTLREAGITKSQISSVELIGGGSRIPKLISIISEHFKPVDVGTHINGDECMALGAVLHAANMSITFKVKQIHLYDGWPFEIRYKIYNDIGQSEGVLFEKHAPNTQKVELDFDTSSAGHKIQIIGQAGEILKTFSISNEEEWRKIHSEDNMTVPAQLKLTFTSSSANIVDLKAHVALNFNETKTRQITDYVKQLLEQKMEQEQDDKEQESDDKEKEKEQEEVSEDNSTDQKQDEDQKEKQEQSQKRTEEILKKLKKKFKTVSVKKNITSFQQKLVKHTVNIQTDGKYVKHNKSRISDLQGVLRKYERKEETVREKAEIKNQLESRLYFLKKQFDEEYMKVFSQKDQLENLKKVVEDKLEWFQDNSYTAETVDLRREYNALVRAANPIFNRSIQYQGRARAVNETFQNIQTAYERTLSLNRTNPWLGEKIDEFLLKINETAKDIIRKLEEQKQAPMNKDPVIYNQQLFRRAEKLREQYYKLSIIPKPRQKKRPSKTDLQPEPQEAEAEKKDSPQTAEGEEKRQEEREDQL